MREIGEQQIWWVRKLLGEGYGQRQVTRLTGVSLSTVNRVANGRRLGCRASGDEEEEEEGAGEFVERCGPIRRCRQCGHRVEMPCLVCQARAVREMTLRSRRDHKVTSNGCGAGVAETAAVKTTGSPRLVVSDSSAAGPPMEPWVS